MEKIELKPYKAHKHLGRGTSSERIRTMSYNGIALTPIERILAEKLNELIDLHESKEKHELEDK